MFALTSLTTTFLLAAAVALGPLAIDLYLPSLPSMAVDLGASTAQVQMTLSVYVAGFALAQLICGPLADQVGRKPVMIGGLVLFALASVGCAMATDIETLMVLRFIQAIGGCAGPVLGRAAVRDIYSARDAARIMALLASIMALAPAIAPTIGGGLVALFGWEACFLALAVYAAINVVLITFGIPEPLSQANRRPFRPARLFGQYRSILRQPVFLGYALTNALVFSSMFSFLAGSSFVLIEFMGVPEAHFGFYFALIVVGYIAGNVIAMKSSNRWLPNQLMIRGLFISVAAAALMSALAMAGIYSVWAVVLPHTLFMVGAGMVLAQAMAGALANFPHMAGAASALFGCMTMASAALTSLVMGQIHEGTSLGMALMMLVTITGALLCYQLMVRRHPAPGFAAATS